MDNSIDLSKYDTWLFIYICYNDKNGGMEMIEKFSNLAQRMAYGHIAAFPDFVAIGTAETSSQSQRQMYGFVKRVANGIFENPDIINLPILPDDCYDDWALRNSKPELIVAMRKINKKIDDFYLLLLKLGELGTVQENRLHVDKSKMKLAPKTMSTLAQFGLMNECSKEESVFWSDDFPDMVPAWKLLSSISMDNKEKSLLLFSHCMFDPAYPHAGGIFRSLVNNKTAFQTLESFFLENGYRRIDNRENEISLDWVKGYTKKEDPLKASWAERTHGGLSVYFDFKKKHPIFFGLRVPMFKELLMHFDDMDDELKEFTIAKTKKCDGCGYCTQTDKTGLRQRQLVSVSHNGDFDLCTLFPGFSFVWTMVDEKTASGIIKFLTFTDQVFTSTM
jgi:hypothetical protein